MVKYLFILINSLSLFLYSLFSGDGGITVTNTFPNSLKPGQEVNVELKIVKGNMSGFAKMQLELPAGIKVKEIDNKGSNFSYAEGIAKWVWSSLPTDNEIVLKLTLVADASATPGKTIVGGKYSFVENNAKQVVEMAPVEIIIGEGVAANNSQTQPANTATTSANNNSGATSTDKAISTNQPNSNREPDGNITVQRTITKGTTDGEYIINLKIIKGATKGFARYSDDLPADLIAKAGKTEGASFSVADGKVKFVWVAVPEKEELELSYTLAGISKPVVLNGEYSFLEQNQSKKYTLKSETITPEVQAKNGNLANTSSVTTPAETKTTSAETTTTAAVAQNTVSAITNTTAAENPVNTNVQNNANNTAIVNNKESDKNNKAKTDKKVNENPKNTVTQPVETISKNEGNVSFMVQIGAFANSAVTAARLKKQYSLTEKIKSDMHEGLSKFMVGNHSQYKDAHDHRENVKSSNGVTNAFVVAYNTGKRITVQEALMISNQKWFK